MAAFLNQEAEAAAPESGEAMKKEVLNKLAAAYEETSNKCIAITLANYIDTAEGIAAEEFTKDIYSWYIGALEGFGFKNQAAEYHTAEEEAAAPESGEAAADLLKMAAALAVGFFGFYVVFAIFGI